MKWYFASRIKNKDIIKSAISILIKQGHNVSYNWAEVGSLKPYNENSKECRKIAYITSASIQDSDIFVLISDKEGTDMYIELGIAISNNTYYKKPKIYAVGQYNMRSMMLNHPTIIHEDSLEKVLLKEFPELTEEELRILK